MATRGVGLGRPGVAGRRSSRRQLDLPACRATLASRQFTLAERAPVPVPGPCQTVTVTARAASGLTRQAETHNFEIAGWVTRKGR